jgi:hypothetical protein
MIYHPIFKMAFVWSIQWRWYCWFFISGNQYNLIPSGIRILLYCRLVLDFKFIYFFLVSFPITSIIIFSLLLFGPSTALYVKAKPDHALLYTFFAHFLEKRSFEIFVKGKPWTVEFNYRQPMKITHEPI